MSFETPPSGRGTVIICDRCGMTEEYEDGRTYVVADVASESGWSVESNEQALCPECVRVRLIELARADTGLVGLRHWTYDEGFAKWVSSDAFNPNRTTFIDDPAEIRARLVEYGLFAAADEEYRKLDDEAEQILRDREIDARVDEHGQWDVAS